MAGAAAVVGVVVVHYGDEGPTVACLAALRADRSACLRQIVVVDNAGNLAGGVASDAAIVRPGRNLGFGAGANAGDIQVNLVDKKHRQRKSHDIALAVRGPLQEIGKQYHANVKVVEVPPGPPVMAPLVRSCGDTYRDGFGPIAI